MYVNINKTYSNCWKRTIYIYLLYLRNFLEWTLTCQVYLCVLWHAQQESDDQVPGRRPFEAPVRLQAGFPCCGARWQRAPFWKGTWWTLYHFSIQFSPRASANFWTTTWGSSAAFFLLCQSNRHKLVHCSHATFQPVRHLLNSSKYCCRTEIFRMHLLILWTIFAACGLHWVRHGTTTLI